MSRLKLSLLAALASSLVTAGILFYLGRSRAMEAASLRDANGRLRFEASQRHQGAPTPPVATPVVTPPVSSPPAPPVASDSASAPAPTVQDYRNEGTATPIAALQTFAWAGDQGDAAAVQGMILFDDAARTKAIAYLETLPAEIRARVATPEQMAAGELTADIIQHPFPRAYLLERATQETVNDDRVIFRLPGSARDRTEFQRTREGWKYVITERMVDTYLARRARP